MIRKISILAVVLLLVGFLGLYAANEVWGDTEMSTRGNISTTGDLSVTGTATIGVISVTTVTIDTLDVNYRLAVDGVTVLGDGTGDSIIVTGRIATDLNPFTDGTFDLGGTAIQWQDLWIDGMANIDSGTIDVAIISGGRADGMDLGVTTPIDSIIVTFGQVGDLDITDSLNGVTIDMTGRATFGGAVALGNAAGDSIIVTGTIGSNLSPFTTVTYDLGTASLLWDSLFVDDAAITTRLTSPKVIATDSIYGATGTYTGRISGIANWAIGSAVTDSVIILGGIASNFIPFTTATFDLGTASLVYDSAWINNVTAVRVNTGDIIATDSIEGVTGTYTGRISGTANWRIGDAVGDSVIITGGIAADVLPFDNAVENLGAAGTAWDTMWVNNITATRFNVGDVIATDSIGGVTGTFTGRVSGSANWVIGNAIDDSVLVAGGIASNFAPFTTATFDLGTASLVWDSAWVANAIIGTRATSPKFVASDSVIGGTITTTGRVSGSGNWAIGNAVGDSVIIIGGIAANLVPFTTATFDLGTAAVVWDSIWAQYVDIANVLTVGDSVVCAGAFTGQARDVDTLGTDIAAALGDRIATDGGNITGTFNTDTLIVGMFTDLTGPVEFPGGLGVTIDSMATVTDTLLFHCSNGTTYVAPIR